MGEGSGVQEGISEVLQSWWKQVAHIVGGCHPFSQPLRKWQGKGWKGGEG